MQYVSPSEIMYVVVNRKKKKKKVITDNIYFKQKIKYIFLCIIIHKHRLLTISLSPSAKYATVCHIYYIHLLL